MKRIRQSSVASLPEKAQDAAMRAVDAAIAEYPAVLLPTGQRLHVFCQGGAWDVWLNCEDADFTGICVAVQGTRAEAVADAIRVFEAALHALRRR